MQTPTSEVPSKASQALNEYLSKVDEINPESVRSLFRGFIASDLMDAMTAIERAEVYHDFEKLQELTSIINELQQEQQQSPNNID